AAYYLALVEATGRDLAGPEQAATLAQLEMEHDNLRAALAWALEARDVRLEASVQVGYSHTQQAGSASPQPLAPSPLEIGLRLAGVLWPLWQRRCHLIEGRRLLDGLLSAPGGGALG